MPEDSILKKIEAAAGREGLRQAPLKKLTSFGCGGPAAMLIEAHNSTRLAAMLGVMEEHAVPWFVIGKGTNLLVADEGYPGVVIRLSGDFKVCEVDGTRLKCGAAAALARAARLAAGFGLSGLEPLAYIPGSLGGAVAMNAGAHGAAIGDLVQSVEICGPGRCHELERSQLNFSYRSLGLEPGSVISGVVLELTQGDEEEIRRATQDNRRMREETQPQGTRSFGSVFKNPPGGASAGSMMDQAGCKQLASGGASVSQVHANFIVNKGNATAAEVVDLMNTCRRKVYKEFGITLEPEVRFLGGIGLEEL